MQLSTLLLALVTTTSLAIPAPAAIPKPKNEISTHQPSFHYKLDLPSTSEVSPLERRQERCDWDHTCLHLFTQCVKTCKPLKNGDCFDAQSSPACEGCSVAIAGC
ncbi:hypothetical protein B0A48_11411 [Cryoendolithus antarcticus]|uniref:Uncharacterized protein n=1 Tax=Cryoendolithus antarcticus TaxID=1507870 RepID=A0A1V8SVI7_9PEZI|nr:hypothetical protein B0A48_11411 [Cryoendolithus antarcticus]